MGTVEKLDMSTTTFCKLQEGGPMAPVGRVFIVASEVTERGELWTADSSYTMLNLKGIITHLR